MSKYNDQYYLVFKAYDEHTLYLTALQKTADRAYEYTQMMFGQPPLFFENAYKERDIKDGVTRPISNLHLNVNFVLVNEQIKEKLENFDILNFQLYPGVIIDDHGNYHERYWFFNMFNKFTALDLARSVIDDFDPDDYDHDVIKYYLSDDILDAIPEEQRLIFKEGKSDADPTIVHQRIVDIFNEAGVTTARFIKISEYEFGKQFRQ